MTATIITPKQPLRLPERTSKWRRSYLAAVDLGLRTPTFIETARACEVSPALLAAHLRLLVSEWSNSRGCSVFPKRVTIAKLLGCSVRQVGRLRKAGTMLGFETQTPRYFIRDGMLISRTSNLVGLHIPAGFAAPPKPPKREPRNDPADSVTSRYLATGELPPARPIPTPAPITVADINTEDTTEAVPAPPRSRNAAKRALRTARAALVKTPP